MRFLVTAGNSREMIDRVRAWSNIFTGQTGFDIAAALAPLGRVDLVTSNATHRAQLSAHPGPVQPIAYSSHADLRRVLSDLLRAHVYDGVFMTAAVADYAPQATFEVVERHPGPAPGEETWRMRDVQAAKVRSHYPAIAVLAQRTEKLVDLFRGAWGHQGLLVKFKLEAEAKTQDLIGLGQASRRASGADYLVANTLDMVTGPDAGAWLLWEGGSKFVPRQDLPATLAEIAKQGLRVEG